MSTGTAWNVVRWAGPATTPNVPRAWRDPRGGGSESDDASVVEQRQPAFGAAPAPEGFGEPQPSLPHRFARWPIRRGLLQPLESGGGPNKPYFHRFSATGAGDRWRERHLLAITGPVQKHTPGRPGHPTILGRLDHPRRARRTRSSRRRRAMVGSTENPTRHRPPSRGRLVETVRARRRRSCERFHVRKGWRRRADARSRPRPAQGRYGMAEPAAERDAVPMPTPEFPAIDLFEHRGIAPVRVTARRTDNPNVDDGR